MPRSYIAVGRFPSSSGGKWYTVNRDEKGDLSCTCPGWCRRTQADGSRSCKHVKEVIKGQQEALDRGLIRAEVSIKPIDKTRSPKNLRPKPKLRRGGEPRRGRRKIK